MSLVLAAPDLALWERFLEGRIPDADVSAHPVLARWARAQRAGAVADGAAIPVGVHEAVVQEARERLAPLVDVGSPFEAFAQSVEQVGFAAFLADVEGVVLRRVGAGALDPALLRTRLVEGACWGEPARGTNAIGTVAAERAPVAVVGAAHFERRNHALVCYAAPIRDVRGELAAVLDASGPLAAAGAFAHAAVVAAAASLEALWVARAYDQVTPGGLFALERVLARLGHAAFVLEPTGRVRLANAAARALLTPADRRDARGFLGLLPGRLPPKDLRLEVEELRDARGVMATVVHLHPRRTPSAPPPPSPAFAAIAGDDPTIAAARERAERFARTDLPVVLLAETGSGKELFARAIHAASGRASGPFVALNCGSLSAALLESELFGYGPGAFTGARAAGNLGKLAAAHRGTLFLDEVAEMPAPLQALLLRFLEDGTYYRVGETQERRADVRVVAATCRDLPAQVAAGAFRSDLYYRIRGATIRLPALRERTDRLALARTLLERLAARAGRRAPVLSPSAQAFVTTHAWPGNVRELRSALEHALALVDGDLVERHHLPDAHDAGPRSLDESERVALLAALDGADGNLSEAARTLGVARTTLYRMMARHGLR